jgi:hypothetical protein
MGNITPSKIRGFIAPFKLTSSHYWATQSTVTQNGDLSGVPAPSEGTDLSIITKGTQTQTVEVTTFRGGHVTDNAGFIWKYEGDNRDYGLETPNKILDVRNLVATTTNENTARDAVRLSTGSVLVAYENVTTLEVNARVARIAVDGSITTAFIDDSLITDLNGNRTYPALCEMPDGSVLCAVWVVDGVADVANVAVWRSKDDGQTWSMVSSRALPSDIDIAGAYGSGATGFKLQPLTLSANNHQVMLLVALYAHDTTGLTYGSIVKQYYSTNEGLEYTFVDESEDGDASHFYLPHVVEHNGVFIIAYISSNDSISFTRLLDASTSVFATLGTIPADTVSANLAVGTANRLEDGDITFYKDTDGRLYLYACNVNKNLLFGAYSDLAGISVEDYASKWLRWGDELNFNATRVSSFVNPTFSGGGIQNIVGVAGQGEQMLFTNYNNIGTNAYDNSLTMVTLGGWSTQQYQRLQPYPNDNQWAYDTQTWIPFDLPAQNSVWSRSAVGTVTEALGGDHITLNVVGTNTIKYYVVPADKTNGVRLHTRISNVTGGSTSAGVAIGARIQQTSSTSTYWVEVVVNSDAVYVYDKHASSLIGSATGLSLPSGVQLLAHVDNKTGQVYVYYADAGSPRQYLQISGVLTLDVSTVQQIYWGIPDGTSSRNADYHFFSYGTGTANGLRWSPNDLNARQYAGRGFYTTIKDGLQISTSSGPARELDTYTIEPQYGSPVQRTLHTVSPSPQVGWRTDSVADPDVDQVPTQTVAWMLDTTLQGTADTHTMSQATGIHLTGINFKEFVIEKYSGGSWSVVDGITNTVGGGLSGGAFTFSRQGASVTCTDASNIYLHLNECRGWSVRLDDGAGNVVVRRVLSSGDGVFASTSSKRAYLHLQGVKATDPTTGTAHLIPDACTVIINENEFAGLRIKISTDKTAEGYFEIGTMVMGHVVITSPQYGRGRTVEFSANVIDSEAPNGTLYSQRQGNGGRLVRVSWTDGVDTSSLNASPADPDHYELYSTSPIAVKGSAPSTMMGLVDYLDGSADAVVYLPSITTLFGGSHLFNRYHEHVLCTLGTSMQIDHVIGDELLADNEGEVFRIATIILREVR